MEQCEDLRCQRRTAAQEALCGDVRGGEEGRKGCFLGRLKKGRGRDDADPGGVPLDPPSAE